MSYNDFLRITRDARIVSNTDDDPVVLELPQGLYGVISRDGVIVVPFGKYDLIERFCLGVARVKIGKETNGSITSNCKWGLIDTHGKVVLPVEYDNMWDYKKGPYDKLRLERNGREIELSISHLLTHKID